MKSLEEIMTDDFKALVAMGFTPKEAAAIAHDAKDGRDFAVNWVRAAHEAMKEDKV